MRYILVILLFTTSIILAEKSNYEVTDIRTARKYILTIEEDLVNEKMKLFLIKGNKIIDSLFVPYVKQVDFVSDYQRKFLKVEFRRGGGSNLKMRYTSIFCVAESKIITSSSLINKIYSHSRETYIPEYDSIKAAKYLENYNTSIKMQKKKNEYSIKINESYFIESTFDTVDNYKWDGHYSLKYNKEHCVFYSSKKVINGLFKVFYLNDTEEYMEINDPYLVIELRKYTYFRMNSQWFYMNGDELYEI